MMVSGPVPLPDGKQLDDIKAIEMIDDGNDEFVGFDLIHRDGRISILRLEPESANRWVEDLKNSSDKFWTLPPIPGS
jgi:hypothetical protein